MRACRFENFDITISGTSVPYAVLARSGGLEATGHFSVDITDPVWADAWAVLADPHAAPGDEQIVQVGDALFGELMQGNIWELWLDARAVHQGKGGLRVRLALHPPPVAALPWETLADARRGQLFAIDPEVLLVRLANLVDYVPRPRSLTAEPPITVLVAALEDPGGVQAEQELARVRKALAPLQPHALRLETLTGRVDAQALQKQIEAVQPHILHIISHGEPDGLYLWTDGELTLVRASQIAAMLRGVDSLRLVVLNACLAGQPSGDAPYASLAHHLLRTGVPAVIAMQFEIEETAASTFAAVLYEQLISGPCPGMVDVAVAAARKALYIRDASRADFVTPVLWLNGEDGCIFHLGAQEPQTQSRSPRESLPPPPLPDIHLEEKEAWFAQLPETIAPLELRFDYLNRRKQLAGLLDLLRKDEAALAAGLDVNPRRVQERLDIFRAEREHMDTLLAWLAEHQPPGQ